MRRVSRSKRNSDVEKAVLSTVPKVTLADFEEIMKIAKAGHLRHLPPRIIAWQSITTHARHNHTDYDELLKEGYDRESARHFVLDQMNTLLEKWGATRLLNSDEKDQDYLA